MSRIIDEMPNEETALLHDRQPKRFTPLPKLQIGILLLLQLAEPISSQCIYPFINQLIRELNVTGGDERKVGYYAGMIESQFFVAEASCIYFWSRLSDKIGRKPVLLTGLAGLTLSMVAFGLARTFTALVISRCLAGLLNGNISIVKSMLGELTDSTNMAQGSALIPVVWCVGATIGPALGGALARPHDNFPNVFSSPFWQEYPYFLPCAAAAGFSLFSFFAALLFLKETSHRHKPDPTLAEFESNIVFHNVTRPSGQEQEGYRHKQPKQDASHHVPFTALLVFPVLISIANNFYLSLLDMSYTALLPLFYSTPIDFGGLGLNPTMIGLCMTAFAVIDGVFQITCFAKLVDRWGAKRLLIVGMSLFVPIFGSFPIINIISRQQGLSMLVWGMVGLQLVLSVVMDMSYACVFLYLTSSAPPGTLGAVNGLAQMVVDVARAVGPGAATSLFALSAQYDLLGGYAVFLVLIILSLLSLLVVRLLPAHPWPQKEEEE